MSADGDLRARIKQTIADNRRTLNMLEPHLGCVACRGVLIDGVCSVCDPAAPRRGRPEMSADDQREVIERDGMWLVSTLGTSFVCRCGWRSGITDGDTADERLSAHVAEHHPAPVEGEEKP